jgi:uncharacterized protein (TIGR03067 family)
LRVSVVGPFEYGGDPRRAAQRGFRSRTVPARTEGAGEAGATRTGADDDPGFVTQARVSGGAQRWRLTSEAPDHAMRRHADHSAAMRRSTIAVLVAALLAGAAVPAGAQVYRSVDANGRVVYTDQPPAKVAAARRGATPPRSDELQGERIVASATRDGGVVLDEKIIGAEWTFKGSELGVRTRRGESQVFTVELEAGAGPNAFTYKPVQPSNQRAGTMIYERAGDRLRIALMDGAEGRAVDFAPRPKQMILVLTRRPAAVGPGVAGAGRDPCEMLRKAGVEDLLRTPQLAEVKGSSPASGSCGLESASGAAVVVQLVPASSRAVLDGQRNRDKNDKTNYAVPKVVEDEPALGAGAFTIKRGATHMTAYALKGEWLLIVSFRHPPGDYARLIAFAQRLLAAL